MVSPLKLYDTSLKLKKKQITDIWCPLAVQAFVQDNLRLNENQMSSNFHKTAVLKKIYICVNCKLKLHRKGFYYQILRAVNVLKFPWTFSLDLLRICPQFFPASFSRQEERFLQTNVKKTIKSGSSACSCT